MDSAEPRIIRFPARSSLPSLHDEDEPVVLPFKRPVALLLDPHDPPHAVHRATFPRLYEPELLTGDVEVMRAVPFGDGEGI